MASGALLRSGLLCKLACAARLTHQPALELACMAQLPHESYGRHSMATSAADSSEPSSSSSNSGSGGAGGAGGSGLAEQEERHRMVSALLYRSKQRGFLELDLLVGMWAQKHVPTMSLQQLRSFSEVLNEENPDLFKWLTGQEAPSQQMLNNMSFQSMKTDVQRQLEKMGPSSATTPGKPWLRGWDDWKKAPEDLGLKTDSSQPS